MHFIGVLSVLRDKNFSYDLAWSLEGAVPRRVQARISTIREVVMVWYEGW